MNLKSLRIFVNVMEEGTLARACQKMNLSQPAASRLIQIFEAEYGTQLFHRERKRLVATRAGEAFFPEAVRILASIDDLPAVFQRIETEEAPPLQIICHPRLAEGLIVPAMVELVRREPTVKLKLEVHPRRYLGRRVTLGLYDVGVATLPLPDQNKETRFLASTEMAVALPEGHVLAGRHVLEPKDVADLPYVALEETTNMRTILDRELAKAEKRLEVTHEMSISLPALRLVKNGLGFTFVDRITLSPDEADGLVVLPWKPKVKIDFCYFVSQTRQPHPARDTFIGILKDICVARSEPRDATS
jgi:DNA-binding transcriptional LysR family regulator